MNRKQVGTAFFFILSLLGSLYLLVEAGLQVLGRSLCVSEGCGLAGRITRFGDLSMIVLGFIAFGWLALMSGFNLRRPKRGLDSAINLALITALAAEGFFVGYQVFWLPEKCLFCLSVLGIVLILGLLRLLSDWKAAVAGFTGFAVVLCCVGLVLPARAPTLPLDTKMILFYSEDCRHCLELKKEIAQKKLEVKPMLVKGYTTTLRSLGVDRVPTLWVNSQYQKIILTGKEAIRAYLAACSPSEMSPPSRSDTHSLKKGIPAKSRISESESPLLPLGTPNPLFNSSQEEGICQENRKCD